MADASRRYPDCLKYMKEVVNECEKEREELTHDERNLLNACFKNPLSLKRRQWRSLIESLRGLPPDVSTITHSDHRRRRTQWRPD